MMTKLLVTIILISALALMAACARGSSEKSSNSRDEARVAFLRSCAVCHGADGLGEPAGAVRAPSLRREDAMNQTDQQLFDLISNGSGNMPSFKNSLTEERIRGLVRYIREEIQGRNASL